MPQWKITPVPSKRSVFCKRFCRKYARDLPFDSLTMTPPGCFWSTWIPGTSCRKTPVSNEESEFHCKSHGDSSSSRGTWTDFQCWVFQKFRHESWLCTILFYKIALKRRVKSLLRGEEKKLNCQLPQGLLRGLCWPWYGTHTQKPHDQQWGKTWWSANKD